MDIRRCIRKPREQRKSILVAIRVTPDISNWLRERNLSPTGIFYEALKELGYQGGRR